MILVYDIAALRQIFLLSADKFYILFALRIFIGVLLLNMNHWKVIQGYLISIDARMQNH